MKKLLLLLFLMPLFAHAQFPLNDRWKLLYEDTVAKEKTFIDTQTITTLENFDGHSGKIYLIWIRYYHSFFLGKYSQMADQHLAIDLNLSQYELKSFVNHNDGNVSESKQFNKWDWIDIVPETRGEFILNYCKTLSN